MQVDIYNICTGKIRYKSKAEAKAKRVQNLQFRNPDLKIYKCPKCFDWHLTSHPYYDGFQRPKKLKPFNRKTRLFHIDM